MIIEFNQKWGLTTSGLNVKLTLSRTLCQLVIDKNHIEILNEKFSKRGHYFGIGYEWFRFEEYKLGRDLCIKLINENTLLVSVENDQLYYLNKK